ncbi:pleiotropic drug resistance protein PDR [Aspergillus sclerotioniger CBS 115572]|uniref:Pleiotropic drug resistance protein PDR n=1 Tax=Aspergillus sclerotioniger CBS 115572 TaxID=1450535 RepID=A0A317WQB5_9EURO|nr:pleiotropic drug resistance protein PDR [Aspergillus sclerotioniger CBS 115572]PWY88623.1 pleiotropic drug resistance protein PDR [Aspergillus sclerotioniger CBS 115572]
MSLLGTINPNFNPGRAVESQGAHENENEGEAAERAAAVNEGTEDLVHEEHNVYTTRHEEHYDNLTPGYGQTEKRPGPFGRDESTLSSAETAMEKRDDSSEDAAEDEKAAEEEVTRLAQRLTRQSTRFSVGGNAENSFLEVKEDSTLNPHSSNFKAKHWMKNLLALSSRDPERYPKREAGVSFQNLSVHGFGSPTDYQKDVANSVLQIGALVRKITGTGKQKIQILRNFDGLVKSGEMLVVLGRPGSGCSTFLKTLAGEMNGIYMDKASELNYQGISAKQMRKQFKGEAIYTAETDVHFPQLTVGDTLKFAALSRCPRNRFPGVSKEQYATHMRDAVMAMLGLSHTINTRVGNDFVRGVSGGERKRVSIAEATLCGSPLQCWDNSTRGLDSANALEFCKTLNLMTKYAGATVAVAIYQASQSAYDVFDKVTVLYEGRQIYFGPTDEAREFFTNMGFDCPERQTTADFLTSLTSPAERIVKPGYEGRVPQTPDEFAAAWRNSEAHAKLLREIAEYNQEYAIGGESLGKFIESRKAMQSKNQRVKSPYTISLYEQVKLCLIRGFQRLQGDASLTISQLVGNFIMALIIGSVFYNLEPTTSSFYSRGALLFFAVLLNAFSSALEILTLYAQRPIVEKQSRYAMYHPFAEAIASMLCDMPYKIGNAIIFNITLYFMTNLRRTPGAFFVFLLFSFVTTLTMSMLFRTIAASSRTLSQALVPAAILILGLVIYTGFTIPTRYMLGWSRWMNYINPIAYGFESLMVNEFHHRRFNCSESELVPNYASASIGNQICSTVGAIAGVPYVEGDDYLHKSFQYYDSHKWRNLGIMFGFMIFLMGTYLLATEYISEAKSKGEVLLFRRGQTPASLEDVETAQQVAAGEKSDQSSGQGTAAIQRQEAIFHWQDVCYDIKIKGEPRRILDHVDGWVKPGTCTALMGVSGAGKTTLLDVLATRVTMGVVTGEMLVDGRPRDQSFQRKTGYVQQQDLHLHTTTVREALRFSAILRQPAHVSRQEKLDYVEEVIKLLGMEAYADAVVGVPGEGLNVEQRKRLTIGVELAAKPQLLLFLDEPTSGLDSQTSWSILDLIDTLTKHGQAILCTIHQPSAMLFQRFDRLLFLARGGKTVYFGEIGDKSSTLASYFERNGAPKLPTDANPAEWMLEVIGAAPGSHSEIDWPAVWRESAERKGVLDHLAELKSTLSQKPVEASKSDPGELKEFAAPFTVQLWECLVRVFSQYWRTPVYIYSKAALCILTSLYIGFSFFKAKNSAQGLQNQMFSIFMLMTIFGNLVQQILPNFCTQRSLYEARERPSKTYSWQAFMTANIIVELPWNALMSVIIFVCWYYPIGLYKNAEPTDAVHERGALMFLLILSFLLFTSTFAHMIIAGIELAETGGNIANLLFSLCLIFCGVLATPSQLPGFWIFMYRVSPFTYLVSGMLSTGVSGTTAVCETSEYLHFSPPSGSTCQSYMADYINTNGGYLENPSATTNCSFCSISSTDAYLAQVSSYFSDAWRNFGLMWVYIIFNIFAAVFIYWLARVPKGQRTKGSS